MCPCLLKWHLAAGSSRVCSMKKSRSPVCTPLCYTHRKWELHESRRKKSRFQEVYFNWASTCLLEEEIQGCDCAVWVVGLFSLVCSAFEMWVTFGSRESGDSSSPTLDIIFTSVTQRGLLLPCLTFWCGTNSQGPTGSPSSAKAVCISPFSSLPPSRPHPSCLSCYYFDWFSLLPCSPA